MVSGASTVLHEYCYRRLKSDMLNVIQVPFGSLFATYTGLQDRRYSHHQEGKHKTTFFHLISLPAQVSNSEAKEDFFDRKDRNQVRWWAQLPGETSAKPKRAQTSLYTVACAQFVEYCAHFVGYCAQFVGYCAHFVGYCTHFGTNLPPWLQKDCLVAHERLAGCPSKVAPVPLQWRKISGNQTGLDMNSKTRFWILLRGKTGIKWDGLNCQVTEVQTLAGAERVWYCACASVPLQWRKITGNQAGLQLWNMVSNILYTNISYQAKKFTTCFAWFHLLGVHWDHSLPLMDLKTFSILAHIILFAY